MPFLITLFIVVVALCLLRTPQGRGWLGEICVKRVIGKTKPGERYVINNYVLQVEPNKTCQVDHILINRKGIFVIETKNYSGRIYGNEKSLEWTQSLNYGKVKNKFYNPIKQNKSHIYHVSQVLSEEMPIISAVVFVQGNTQYIQASGVYTLRELKCLISQSEECLSCEEMEKVYQELSDAAANDYVSKREHIQNIEAMKNDIANNVCPRCGRVLVLRNGRNGSFYGCSGYPSCRFTKRV